MGPVTMTFTYGRKQTSYDEFYCADLHHRINEAKKKNGSNAKVISGGSGTWQSVSYTHLTLPTKA